MFNIRVYGILIHNSKVLVTDEFRLGVRMTKFPGGGLEKGEGTIDCLKREWMEETGNETVVESHYYTTDFFQPSMFLAEVQQMINIYYLVSVPDPGKIKTSVQAFDFELIEGAQSFRWISLDHLNPDEFTLPIDKVLVKKLSEEYEKGYFLSNKE